MHLLAVGASVRALTESLRRAGCTVTAADLFADRDLQCQAATHRCDSLDDLEAVFDWVACAGLDGWTYAGGMENRPGLVALLASKLPLFGCSADAIAEARRPEAISRTLSGILPTVPNVSLTCAPPGRRRWLRKPIRSAGGKPIEWADARSSCDTTSSSSPRPYYDQEYYYQEYIAGRPASALFIAHPSGATLVGAATQWIGDRKLGAPPLQYAGSFGPLDLHETDRQTLLAVGDRMAAAWGLRGWFGVDYVQNDRGIWPIEINPRYVASAEIYEWAGGAPWLARRHLAAAQFPPLLDPAPNRWTGGPSHSVGHRVAKGILYWTQKNAVRIHPAFSDWAFSHSPLCCPRAIDQDFCLADIPMPHTEVRFGSPVLSILIRRPIDDVWTEQDAQRDIHRAASLCRRQLSHVG